MIGSCRSEHFDLSCWKEFQQVTMNSVRSEHILKKHLGVYGEKKLDNYCSRNILNSPLGSHYYFVMYDRDIFIIN